MRTAQENFELQKQYDRELNNKKIEAMEEVFKVIDGMLKDMDDKTYTINIEGLKKIINKDFRILLNNNTNHSNILDAFLKKHEGNGFRYHTKSLTNPDFLKIYAIIDDD